jgi:hypothetical protein
MTPLGFPASSAPERKRKGMDEVVFWESFGGR